MIMTMANRCDIILSNQLRFVHTFKTNGHTYLLFTAWFEINEIQCMAMSMSEITSMSFVFIMNHFYWFFLNLHVWKTTFIHIYSAWSKGCFLYCRVDEWQLRDMMQLKTSYLHLIKYWSTVLSSIVVYTYSCSVHTSCLKTITHWRTSEMPTCYYANYNSVSKIHMLRPVMQVIISVKINDCKWSPFLDIYPTNGI